MTTLASAFSTTKWAKIGDPWSPPAEGEYTVAGTGAAFGHGFWTDLEDDVETEEESGFYEQRYLCCDVGILVNGQMAGVVYNTGKADKSDLNYSSDSNLDQNNNPVVLALMNTDVVQGVACISYDYISNGATYDTFWGHFDQVSGSCMITISPN
jgi:hypothetical protein